MAKRQREIPGTERSTIPELEEIVEPYVVELYNALEAQQAAKALRSQLIERMRQLKVKTYTHVDGEYEYSFNVEQIGKLKTKRKRVGAEDEGEAVEGDAE